MLKWLFDPFFALGVYFILVAVMLDRGGREQSLLIACSVVPFQLVMTSFTSSLGAVRLRRSILTNMRFARGLLPLATVLTETVAFGAALTLLAATMAFSGISPTLSAFWLLALIPETIVLALAFAYPATIFGLLYPDLRSFGVSAIRTLYFLGPSLVALEAIHGVTYDLLKLNPLSGIFEGYRAALLYGETPPFWTFAIPLGYAALSFADLRPALPGRVETFRQGGRVSTTRIEAVNAGVRFLFDGRQRTVTPRVARIRRGVESFWGLRDLSLAIEPGEAVALLGPSGAGKSTLLRLLAGVFEPDEGAVTVEGRVATLLSIEAGLMDALTGRENASLLGVLYGLGYREARTLDTLAAESGLDGAFERPVGSYSQGMRARIGFTIARKTDPTILLLDEVHEALDHEFRAEVGRYANGLLDSGGIVVAAGHDHPLLEAICTRAVLMRDGAIVDDGPFTEVQARYLSS